MASILLVEDDPLISIMVADWLKEIGHATVGPVTSVEEALSFVNSVSFQAAILDVHLGKETTYPIAEVLIEQNIPFAFATGDCGEAIEQRFSSQLRLSKPFDFQSMCRVVDTLIGDGED